jgi:3-oxoadipate enol-lactonase
MGKPGDEASPGQREYEALMGSPPEETLAAVRATSPQLYEAVVEGAFGGPLARPELSRREREIATVAILAALGGAERQLAVHAAAALRNDVAPSELLALCEHVAVYAGFPRALNALREIDQVLGEGGIPRPPSLRPVDLRDHETVVAQAGEEGPAVLLSHALGLDWRMWEPVMPALAAGRRVYAYDIRGHGSAAGSPKPFTMDDAAADLVGVLDAVGVEKAHVVGLSYGAASPRRPHFGIQNALPPWPCWRPPTIPSTPSRVGRGRRRPTAWRRRSYPA